MRCRLHITVLSLCIGTILFAQEPKLMLPIGHTSNPINTTFSPNGKYILTRGFWENEIKIWDAVSGILLTNLEGHTGRIVFSNISPDGKRIISASDSTVKIWDASAGVLLLELPPQKKEVYFVKFSTDGKKFITRLSDNTAKMWDADSGNFLFDIEGSFRWSTEILFSPDGKKIISDALDSTFKIWDASSGKIITWLKEITSFKSAVFSPDGKKIVLIHADTAVRIYDVETGIQLSDLNTYKDSAHSVNFSTDGSKIVTASKSKGIKTWDVKSGNLLSTLKNSKGYFFKIQFSPGGDKILACSNNGTATIWDLISGNVLFDFKERTSSVASALYSPDGNKIITTCYDKTIKLWDAGSGDFLVELKSHSSKFLSASFSPDGKKIVTASEDNRARIWDTETADLISILKGHKSVVESAEFSPDGKKIVTASDDNTAKIWDAATAKELFTLKGHNDIVRSAHFGPDGKKIITVSEDGKARVWDATTAKLQLELVLWTELDTHHSWRIVALFSPDGKKIITSSLDSSAKIWDASSGAFLLEINLHTSLTSVAFSPNGKTLITATSDSSVKIWDADSGKYLYELKGNTPAIIYAVYSPDGKKIITISGQYIKKIKGFWRIRKSPIPKTTIQIWDVATGSVLKELIAGQASFAKATFHCSPDGKRLISSVGDNKIIFWDMQTGRELYSLFTVDSSDYLVYDKDNHYDGTEAARKLLYLTCGTEVIELEQVQDQLWVPNLAERIMSGDSINAPKLADLNICNLTPVVETIDQTATQYRFRVTPRLGGLGATIVYVNSIEVKRYTPQQLVKQKETYQLAIDKKELQKFFVPGKENSIAVKSLTAKNSISSRSASINEKGNEKPGALPDLYAVVVGVSDYKGEELDLKFAAKDAADMSNALGASARKLLNTDGKEHVYIYNINTGAGRDRFPEKNSIRQAFTDIAAKAQPNDILLVFFAGHGVMESGKNQFYFLTADASTTTVFGALNEVGISTDELTEWIKPQVMKAQKRILIFDACNSGQVIKEIISIGKKEQHYVAARGDEKSRQIKAVEKLNERSGMFILSASASDQKAYEMGKYNQGALTYSLLKAIKEQPDILEDRKYLNISRWFNAAEKSVNELARETGARQQPQIVSTTNFNIGVVDEEVRNKIVLPFEKPMFTRSDFRNTAALIDNLKLRSLVDKELIALSDEAGASLLYSPEYEGQQVYQLSGAYTVSGSAINVSVIITRGGTEIKTTFEVKGMTDQLASLAKSISTKVMEWLNKK